MYVMNTNSLVLIITLQKGTSALMSSSQEGHKDIVVALLSAGANTNIQDKVSKPDISVLVLLIYHYYY